MAEMPWLRFHAYGVGLPKTGTTSLARMLARYRTGHETSLDFLASHAVARARGEIDDATFWNSVRWRFVPLRAEMDAVTCHHLYADLLAEHYPGARFVVTYRDVCSWANSILGITTATRRAPADVRGRRTWHLTYAAWVGEGTIPVDPAYTGDDTVALPALMRAWAAYLRRMIAVLPEDRTMWLRTAQLTECVPELADFLGIPADSIVLDQAHSNRTRISLDRFAFAERDAVDSAYAEHCADLMAEHFPDEHAAFLTRPQTAAEPAWSAYLRRVDEAFDAELSDGPS